MKRIIALFAVIFLLLSSLSGCVKIERITPSSEDADDPYASWDFEPPLWRVTSKDGGVLYLFGTIHVGDERTEVVISRLEDILSSCDALALEFDLIEYESNIEEITKEVQSLLYTDGTTIKDHVSAELYERMEAAVLEIGYPVDYIQNYNLYFWSQLISEKFLGGDAPVSRDYAADMLLNEWAYGADVPVYSVESGAFQFNLLNSFSDELNALLISETLDTSVPLYYASMSSIYNLWLFGDPEILSMAFFAEDSSGLDDHGAALIEEYNYKLITERNIGMAKTAEEYISSGETVFFAVGCGHMVGDGGIVELLTDRGYTVERITIW